MAHLVECPPPTPEAWIQSPLQAAGEAGLFGIHICSDILVLCISSAESTWVIQINTSKEATIVLISLLLHGTR